MQNIEQKRIFLLACGSPEQNNTYAKLLKLHFNYLSFYEAGDAKEILFKVDNAPPHVVVIDASLPRTEMSDLIPKLLNNKERMAIIVLSPDQDSHQFVDEVVTGQVQFILRTERESLWVGHINRALNWIAERESHLYHIRFCAANEILIREGELANNVFFVRSGKLKASVQRDAKEVILGYIEAGEFVGEMAFINGEPRSADVSCLADTEVIEIPHASLDSLLFSRPSWSKALMKSLSRRIKVANSKEVQSEKK